MGRGINAQQKAVLAWLAEGGSSNPPEPTYKQSAVALANRGLAHVQRVKGVWTASLTDAGRHYVEHGTFPDDPPVNGPASGKPTAPNATKPEVASLTPALPPTDQLIADVQAAGDLLVVPDPRDSYAQLVQTSIRHGKVPAGKRLVLTCTSYREGTVALVAKPQWMSEGPVPVKVVGRLRNPHPIVASVRDNPRRLPYRREVRQRALRALDSIALAAVERGWEVRAPNAPRTANSRVELLAIDIQGHVFCLSINEESNRVPHTPTVQELEEKKRWSWTRIPEYDSTPSGRLAITIDRGSTVLQSTFRDTKTIDVFDRLPLLMHELELRAASAEDHRIERERQEAERRSRWERVRAEAEVQLVETHRESTLLECAHRWLQHQQVTDYLSAATDSLKRLDPADKAEAEEWLAWCHQHLARLNPLIDIAMPTDPEPTPEALRPFMRGLSPHGPDRWT